MLSMYINLMQLFYFLINKYKCKRNIFSFIDVYSISNVTNKKYAKSAILEAFQQILFIVREQNPGTNVKVP